MYAQTNALRILNTPYDLSKYGAEQAVSIYV